MIRAVELYDAPVLADIYNYYVESTLITFEETLVSPETFAARIKKSIDQGFIWLVLEDEKGVVVGYAYTSLWRERSAYRFVHEVTVYLNHQATGKGYGSLLFHALLEQIKKTDITNLMAVIALPNEASVALHERYGMEKTGHFAKVGYKFSQWVDVGYWQLSLPK